MLPLLSDDLWVLHQLHRVGYKSAIIGGGAIRDAYFDRPPNDIDIYVWASDASNETIDSSYRHLDEKKLVTLFNLDAADQVKRLGQSYSDRVIHIKSVFSVYNDTLDMVYQIIVLNKSPIEYVTRYFDIGLCMCYCDGVKMRYTNNFIRDAQQKTLTICGELTEQEYNTTINQHLDKMKLRFPNFIVVDNLKGTF